MAAFLILGCRAMKGKQDLSNGGVSFWFPKTNQKRAPSKKTLLHLCLYSLPEFLDCMPLFVFLSLKASLLDFYIFQMASENRGILFGKI